MFTLTDIQKLSGVRIMNLGATLEKATGVSTDSRSIAGGNLFVALRGEAFDGHHFVHEVIKKGASAAVVDEAWFFTHAEDLRRTSIPFICVPDTTKALGELAHLHRMRFSIPIIAIGGSNGKTTTKEMVAAVLQQKMSVLSTQGNLNNQIGVPQMLFRLTKGHHVAVLELGTNHPGELEYLSRMVEPTHVLVTNVGHEHLEFFEDLEGVAEEETALYRCLDSKGIAFVNIDDPFLMRASRSMKSKFTYSTTKRAHLRAGEPVMDALGRAAFSIAFAGKTLSTRFVLGVPGRHNLSNGLAAAAVGMKFGVPQKSIAAALKAFTGVSKRMEVVHRNGLVILNDTYNANPDSVRAALATLGALKVSGKKIVVLADMLELGGRAQTEHEAIGVDVAKAGFELLFAFGRLGKLISDASGLAGARHFSTKKDLISALKATVQEGDAVLVKGSRGMKMEEVVDQL